LYQAQIGQQRESAKPLHGFAKPVWEVRAQQRSGAYRAIYVVHFQEAVYVLHAFQKKSKSGASTPRREIQLVHQRLNLALEAGHRRG
jgi:phage-related protein